VLYKSSITTLTWWCFRSWRWRRCMLGVTAVKIHNTLLVWLIYLLLF